MSARERWILHIITYTKCVSEVSQSCPTLCNPMDCSPPGSSIHGIYRARILEWVAISFSRESSWPWDQTWASRIASRCFTIWATLKHDEPHYLWAIPIKPCFPFPMAAPVSSEHLNSELNYEANLDSSLTVQTTSRSCKFPFHLKSVKR